MLSCTEAANNNNNKYAFQHELGESCTEAALKRNCKVYMSSGVAA